MSGILASMVPLYVKVMAFSGSARMGRAVHAFEPMNHFIIINRIGSVSIPAGTIRRRNN